MRALKISSLFLIATLTISGCTAAEEEPVATATPSPVVTQEPEPEPEPIYVTAALTGVEYLEGENLFLELPAISAKIDNTSAGRPQLALNDADIVYVTRVEVGLTRLLPVWH